MKFNQYSITSSADPEVLVAFLSEAGFDSFAEGEGEINLLAYRKTEEHELAVADLARIGEKFPLTHSWSTLPDKNWNEEWEKQFDPIRVGNKLGIRASFHQPLDGVKEELIIDPKMAFGTGHHATTYMVSDLMFGQDFKGKRILDYGSGTGVLALLAKRLGASFAWAVDIERPSYENTLENAFTNQIEIDVITHGTLDDVPDDKKFDMILANINRNVILASLASLYDRLTAGGKLFVSGILRQDAKLVMNAAKSAGFSQLEHQEKEGWQAWVFVKE